MKEKGNSLTSLPRLDFELWERIWGRRWEKAGLYRAKDFGKKKKEYILVEFPYPSGSGLHVGHAFTMTGADIYARKERMAGRNVLFPMGWDAFGLPTENYAISAGRKPREVTEENTDNFRRQMKKMAFSFDWSREINTTDSDYYHWTQWIFIQLFKEGLAYKKAMPINWCPRCKIGLANEEVVDGRCERCGAQVIRRKQNQWIVKITDYADRLIKGLEETDFVEKVKKAQINWIGKSKGAKIKFKVQSSKFKVDGSSPSSHSESAGLADEEPRESSWAGSFLRQPADQDDERRETQNNVGEIEVFTTRPDTLWGATFMVIAPEHWLAEKITNHKLQKTNKLQIPSTQIREIREYVEGARKKSELERTDLAKEKTGVSTGLYAINPATRKKIPIWISDFVLESYGTGAIMAVPAHDERDWQFAKKFGLPIIPVVEPRGKWDFTKGAYTEVDQGKIINSGFINGLVPKEAIKKTVGWLEREKIGRREVNYHLRDWIFSRQHYWGEPIPMIFCEHCSQNIKLKAQSSKLKGNDFFRDLKKYAEKEEIDLKVLLDNPGWFPVPEKELPVRLPEVENYRPTDSGESPLAVMKNWLAAKCPYCGGEARRETDTMPNWAGSDWYYLAYCFADKLNGPKSKVQSPKSKNIFEQSKNILSYWLPVDLYIGGDEHNTLHLLYSRFIYQFLHDLGVMPEQFPEPYYRRISHGVILGADGQRMSKSRGNVINPDDKWRKYGVDALRMYLMFMGPFEATIIWNENALKGIERFLLKFKNLIEKQAGDRTRLADEAKRLVHQLIVKVSADIDNFSYNTAIAAMMKTLNTIDCKGLALAKEDLDALVKLLAPFAPYLAEELWCRVLKNKFSVHLQPWPTPQKEYLRERKNTIIVQVNGRMRGKIDIESDVSIDKDKVILLTRKEPVIKKFLSGREIKKAIFVPGKLINFVI
jgi:leucyl-tRNA synthetase